MKNEATCGVRIHSVACQNTIISSFYFSSVEKKLHLQTQFEQRGFRTSLVTTQVNGLVICGFAFAPAGSLGQGRNTMGGGQFKQRCSQLFEQLKTTCSFINIAHTCLSNIVHG